MGDNDTITIETLYVSFQKSYADLREQVVTLREHSAKRNGYVESINVQLGELKEMVANRPCEDHTLRLAALEQDEGQDKERWGKVIEIALEILKYVITLLISAVFAYIWFKLTGVTP